MSAFHKMSNGHFLMCSQGVSLKLACCYCSMSCAQADTQSSPKPFQGQWPAYQGAASTVGTANNIFASPISGVKPSTMPESSPPVFTGVPNSTPSQTKPAVFGWPKQAQHFVQLVPGAAPRLASSKAASAYLDFQSTVNFTWGSEGKSWLLPRSVLLSTAQHCHKMQM